MKRKNKLLFTIISMACLLTACDNTSASDPISTPLDSTGLIENSGVEGISTSVTSTSIAPVEEEYAIQVQSSSGLQYTLNKTKAKKGEEIVLTLNPSVGYSVNSVTMNNTELTGKNNVYTFTMPNRSVLIVVRLDVQGNVTIVGDIAAILNLEENGIYAARNVRVDSATKAYFSYQIQGENNTSTLLDSIDLDETRCFANVTFSNDRSKGSLVIEGGCTYDFFYNPASLYPCYVIRTEVNYLPNSVSALYSLFEGTMRSESTVNYPELNGITYSITDIDNTRSFNFDYKIYENNTSLVVLKDLLDLDDSNYYVYKSYDEENKLLTIVDTYTLAMGNNDKTRGSYNNNGAYAARYDVVSDGKYPARTEVTERDALHIVNHSAHYGYEFEREFMYSYRVISDSFNSKQVNIASTKDAITSNITTTIDSYTEDDNDAEMYDVDLVFDKAGRLLSLNYIKKQYSKSDWDYTKHTPDVGKTGRTTQRIICTYSYGKPLSGNLNFSTDPYFIKSIDALRFYNPKTEMPANDDNSYLHYNDKVNMAKSSENDNLPYLNKLEFSPATALDLWQYGPTSSSDTSVITKQASDLWNVMTCVGVGSATVTFSNNTKNSGVTKDVKINVNATAKFHSISIYSLWDGFPGSDNGKIITTATSANIMAGTQTSFKISVTPSNAPVIYEAVSEKPDLLQIVETGEKLTLDTTGAANITTATKVRVRITSDWFQEESSKQVMFTFTIVPASVNPVGSSWEMVGYEEHIKLVFTDTVYDGDTYVGYIEDDGVGNFSSLRVSFCYSYKNGMISGKVTAIAFSNNLEGWSTHPADYGLDFYYDAENDQMGVFLVEGIYESDYESFVYSYIYGECSDDGTILSYTAFARS